MASKVRTAARCLAAGGVLGIASWAAYAGIAWIRYGHAKRSTNPDEADPLLDRFMATYEVAERHRVRVAASAEFTFAAAAALDIQQSTVVRGIFKSPEWILGSEPDKIVRVRTLVAWAKELGWAVLAEVEGREMVFGAVTRPWEAKVIFCPVPPGEFARFHEPGYVKIAWTLRAEPAGAGAVARTETRVSTTDPDTRQKFRRYWAFFSPGIRLIRHLALKMVKREAERAAGRV
jgi:hypothetical protein